MAKKQSFSDKSNKRAHTMSCPVCKESYQFIKLTKATKGDKGAWKFKDQNIGVCKCNNAEVYGQFLSIQPFDFEDGSYTSRLFFV